MTLREFLIDIGIAPEVANTAVFGSKIDWEFIVVDPMAQTTSINRGIQSINSDGSRKQIEMELDRS